MRALDADNACGDGGNPPPRTISDFAAILDAERPDPKKIEQLRAAADRKPPTNASPAELSGFYDDRGNGRYLLGRSKDAKFRGGAFFVSTLPDIASARPDPSLRSGLVVRTGTANPRNGFLVGCRRRTFGLPWALATCAVQPVRYTPRISPDPIKKIAIRPEADMLACPIRRAELKIA